MTFKVATPAILIFLSCYCTSPQPKAAQSGLLRILEDTTNNRRAKWDLDQLKHYTNLCKAIGIRPLYDGVDSFEVRIWRQFSVYGMATNEEIYSLSVFDTTVTLTFYRVYCKQESYENEGYKYWNPFTEPVIDSFFAISKSFPVKIANNLDLQKLWGLKTQSALQIPDSIGFLDGTVHSIELASRSKYKLIRYHEAEAYYNATKIEDIKRFVDAFDKLIILFQSKKVYE